MQFVIQGDQDLKLSAEEAALVLDSLAVQPFNKVSGLINKLIGQIQYNMKMAQEGSVPRGVQQDDRREA